MNGKNNVEAMESQKRGDTGGPPYPPGWKDWMTYSSCHGVRYVADDKSPRVRRFVWLVLVVLAICLLVYCLASRIQFYYAYEVTTDVTIIQQDSVMFPAVTICNLNKFRKTKASEYQLYDFLEEYYDKHGEQAKEVVDDNESVLRQTDTTTFMTDSAHQIGDLIQKCKWDQEACNMDNDFERVFTDLGVCYTYTGNQIVTSPGKMNGLSLMLNLEQDEYMNGPQDNAGIKVFIHDIDESPLMSDSGFILAPGTYTMAKIAMTQTENLPAPYGACDPVHKFRSDCELQCESEKWKEECGCSDLHHELTDGSSPSVCGMVDLFNCQANEFSLDCDCAVPCSTTKYDAKLSYAQFSRYSIEKMANNSKDYMDNMLTVDIFYEDLTSTLYTQRKAFDVMSLFAEIGGLAVITLGASILTLCELIDWIIVNLCAKICRKKEH